MARACHIRFLSRNGTLVCALVSIFAEALPATAQAVPQLDPAPFPGTDSVTVTPGAAYRASALYRALSGSGHRDLWTTPIRVAVADMGALGGGGLTPVELGGGTTTTTLHLRGADGRRYVFRSVDKTPRELIEDLEGTVAEAIIQDQMSSFHPSAAPVVARLLEAVDVLHPEPRLVVVPDDPRLGEFREMFAGMLVLFEERPDDLPEGEAGFAGSTRIVQTDVLFDELEDDPANRVELRELLRARLVDILVGDRDRSTNNHLWARFEDGDSYLWRPIPRDRDQTFVQFDGFLKALARFYEYRLVPFRNDYANTQAVTRNAWDIDRILLVGLDRTIWDVVVGEVMTALTDGVIAQAVARMPPEHYAVTGAGLEATLRARRDELRRVAGEFYDIVFRYADVLGTDAAEVAVLEGLDGGRVRLALHRRGASSEPEGPPHFERIFSPGETREIRLYLRGGNDRAIVRGLTSTPIEIRVVGGGDADEIASSGGPEVTFYDGGNQTVVEGARVEHVDRTPSRPYAWFEDSYDLDWGSRTWPLPGLSYDADRGLIPVVGLSHDRFGFDRLPFAYRLSLRGGWAFSHSTPVIDASLHVRRLLGVADLRLQAAFSGIEVVNFFGLGNETDDDGPRSFYKVHQEQLSVAVGVSVGDGGSWEAVLGPVFKRVVSDTTEANVLAEVRPLGTGTFSQAGLRLVGTWDGRDRAGAPTGGLRLTGGAEYYPGVADVEDPFGSVHGEVAAYLTPAWGNPTLAARVGGKKLWGGFPYYEAAFLGGASNVRGLHEERYAGDAMLYASAELRVFLVRLAFILPVDLGVFALGDVGRAFLDGDSSARWRTGAGGGVWLAPLSRSGTFRVSVAASEGRTSVYGGVGFAF